MLRIDVTLEDIRIMLDRDNESGLWQGTILDSLNGETAPVGWTDAQLAAVLAVAIDADGSINDLGLYDVAGAACEGMPDNLRPIP